VPKRVVQTRRFKLSNARFAVVAEGIYDREIEFIAAGNLYYTRRKELTCLLKAAEKAGWVSVLRALGLEAVPKFKLDRKKEMT
jgi:hypothetical protein